MLLIKNKKLKNQIKSEIIDFINSYDELYPGLYVNKINFKNSTVEIEYLDEYDNTEYQTLSLVKYLNKCLRACGQPRIKKITLKRI